MKKFTLIVLYWIFCLSLFAFIFELLFTYSHYKQSPRNPVSWLMSMDDESTYDYVVLGSSRALYHWDPNQIFKLTQKEGVNFGLQDAQPFDIKLFTIEVIRKKLTKNIYIHIDDSWNNRTAGDKSTLNWLPFIHEDEIWSEFSKLKEDKYYYYKNIPFYKYANYDSEIGIRDYIKGLAGQKLSTIETNGYLSLDGTLRLDKRNEKYRIHIEDTLNEHIIEIINLCKAQNINLIFFTSPIYNAIGNHDILNKYLPNYFDFTDLFSSPEYFSDSRHMNSKGTQIFNDAISELFK